MKSRSSALLLALLLAFGYVNAKESNDMSPAHELSEAEYMATFSPPMVNATDTAEALVDLWGYAGPVLEGAFPGEREWTLKHIYESRDGEYQHLYIPVPRNNTYLLVIVSKPQRRIIGHYLLDLGRLYMGEDK